MTLAKDFEPQAITRRPGRPRNREPSVEHRARLAEIVETAAKVFREKGYDAGSMDDVAAELNLRKASLYYYVHSKAELLYRIFDKIISTALSSVEKCLSIDDPKERLAALIRHQAIMVASEPSFFTVFFDQRPRLARNYDSEILAKERQYLHVYQEAVASAVESGALPSMRARYGAQAVLGMTSWIYKWFDSDRDDPQAFADACVNMILRSDDHTDASSEASEANRSRQSNPEAKSQKSLRVNEKSR